MNATDSVGQIPLHYAAKDDQYEIAQLLLEAGADPNHRDNRHQYSSEVYGNDTPLHDAVGRGSSRMVRLLLAYGADPEITNAKGMSPLEIAKRDKATSLVRLLESNVVSQALPTKPTATRPIDQLLTVEKVAELLSVDAEFVNNLVRAGTLKILKLTPDTVRIPAVSLSEYLASLSAQHAPGVNGQLGENKAALGEH